MDPVYLDHAATTPVRPEARDAMLPFLGAEGFGNPSSMHRFGRTARGGLEQARRQVALALGAESGQVFFTSGGTEADNLAVMGAALAARRRGGSMRVAVSAIEHKAVLAAAHAVHRLGGVEEVLRVSADGVVDLDALDAALASRPAVVSVMWVNNEIGVIQPIAEIGRRCRAAGVLFHTDAVQAFGNLPVRFADTPCDLLTVSAHKVGGPKGIGALIVRNRQSIEPLIQGGGQQSGLRPGTENIAGAAGFGRAAELAAQEQPEHASRLTRLRTRLAERLLASVPDLVVVGERAERAPHILNVCVPSADSGALLMHLDLAGVAVSSGSACASGAADPSPVLTAMGIPAALAAGALRFSLGRDTDEAGVDRAAEVFPGVVAKVRAVTGALARA
ncbi:MAG TPA: cysteine desulfurase family protein [Gemmatimonadales bacterium]|nr:cysteine desulfurase family protein [Gemmatimonadales bacterium]